MKTVKEWLEELPEGYRELAKNNISKEKLNKKYSTISSALVNSFIWSESPEGWNFWYEVSNYFEQSELPNLPSK